MATGALSRLDGAAGARGDRLRVSVRQKERIPPLSSNRTDSDVLCEELSCTQDSTLVRSGREPSCFFLLTDPGTYFDATRTSCADASRWMVCCFVGFSEERNEWCGIREFVLAFDSAGVRFRGDSRSTRSRQPI